AIFLSYRRDDSAGFAGRLADALEAEFGPGSVFRDVDDIRPGEDFVQAIESHLREVSAVLVMIGPTWLGASSGGKRRLDDTGDFVRQEIQAALASGKPLIPLLVSNATMPLEADLPAAIAGLSRRQAVVLSDSNWRGDVQRFVKDLRILLRGGGNVWVKRHWVPAMIGAVIGLAAMGWAFQAWRLPLLAEPVQPAASSSPTVDVIGRWTARVKYDWGDQYEEVFEFKYLGDALHGTASYQTGRLTIEQASLKGNWITFMTRSQEMLGSDSPWKEVTHRYTGQVTPEGIHFTLESGGGYSIHPTLTFTAQQVQKP
ncbi:MAG: toll/interleukin-1 receptor domain-containing protein, partial [Burkholderiaceae bacterium]